MAKVFKYDTDTAHNAQPPRHRERACWAGLPKLQSA